MWPWPKYPSFLSGGGYLLGMCFIIYGSFFISVDANFILTLLHRSRDNSTFIGCIADNTLLPARRYLHNRTMRSKSPHQFYFIAKVINRSPLQLNWLFYYYRNSFLFHLILEFMNVLYRKNWMRASYALHLCGKHSRGFNSSIRTTSSPSFIAVVYLVAPLVNTWEYAEHGEESTVFLLNPPFRFIR